MAFIDKIKERAKADKKTIVLPESMDKRTYEAAEKILKEGIANLIIIGTPEEIEKNGKGFDISGATIVDPYNEFEGCVNYMLTHPDTAAGMGENGRKYVDANYTWEKITDRFIDIVERVCN